MGLLWKESPARSSSKFPVLFVSFELVETVGPPSSPSKSIKLLGMTPPFVVFFVGVIGSLLDMVSLKSEVLAGRVGGTVA